MKIPVVIEFHQIEKEPAPDGIEVLFVSKGCNWNFGTWDSDHNHYTDQHSHDIYDVVLWAYLPQIPTIFPSQIIATDEACIALLKEKHGKENS